MNILYCGDKNIEDGLILSVLSLLKNVKEALSIYILTMQSEDADCSCQAVTESTIEYLNQKVKQSNVESFVKKIDMTKYFQGDKPLANLKTRFTPFCMLRLYADLVEELPDRLLYLDNDVICRGDLESFYYQDMHNTELAGVLDYYGSWFFRKQFWKRDYVNSGVLLLNLERIRETKLFEQCRKRCREKKMFMPDQSAINKYAVEKKLLARRYNEQRKLHANTVLQHFTTSFRFLPWFHKVSVKPWQIEKMHRVLKLHEYDALLEEYVNVQKSIQNENQRTEGGVA